jgi:hypothetical protein
MVRRANTQAVSAQMYRHFAVLTVAVTLVVGVFADGESRQAVASEVRAAQRPAAHAGPTRLARKDSPAQASFSSDGGFDGNFGAPMDAAGAAAQDGVLPGDYAAGDPGGLPAGFTQYGVPSDTWASLTEAQKKALMARQKAAEAAAQAPERAAQIDSLLAASRARSGEATADD